LPGSGKTEQGLAYRLVPQLLQLVLYPRLRTTSCGRVRPLIRGSILHGTEAGREAQVNGGPLVEMLTDQVAYRRDVVATRDEEIRRRDVIILQLTSRIPEIEAPPTPAQTPTPSGGHEDPTQQSAEPEIGGEPTRRRRAPEPA
jgi:hypothetical protein